jgi:hypothetical protein
MTELILYDLPKISLNQWYAGKHWSKRTEIKDNYKWIIKSQFKSVFKNDKQYKCEYLFYFKNNPLDASNCVGMLKMIEDCLFEKDGYNQVIELKISSEKSDIKRDYVKIIIN